MSTAIRGDRVRRYPATAPRLADLDNPACWWCAADLATVVRSRDAGDGVVTVEGLCAGCDRAIDALRAERMATAATLTTTPTPTDATSTVRRRRARSTAP
jgi:ribosomal protein S11